jgi:hypothetical protein
VRFEVPGNAVQAKTVRAAIDGSVDGSHHRPSDLAMITFITSLVPA